MHSAFRLQSLHAILFSSKLHVIFTTLFIDTPPTDTHTNTGTHAHTHRHKTQDLAYSKHFIWSKTIIITYIYALMHNWLEPTTRRHDMAAQRTFKCWMMGNRRKQVEGGQFGRSICHTTTRCELTYCLPQPREERNIQMGVSPSMGHYVETLKSFIFKTRL